MSIVALDFSTTQIYIGMILQGLFTGLGVGLSAGIIYIFKRKLIRKWIK